MIYVARKLIAKLYIVKPSSSSFCFVTEFHNNFMYAIIFGGKKLIC